MGLKIFVLFLTDQLLVEIYLILLFKLCKVLKEVLILHFFDRILKQSGLKLLLELIDRWT
jgi:hypothetical protein